jgi:hypothetical protein
MNISQLSFKLGSQFILVFCGGHELIVFELKSSLFMCFGVEWVGWWGARVWAGGEGEGIIYSSFISLVSNKCNPNLSVELPMWE